MSVTGMLISGSKIVLRQGNVLLLITFGSSVVGSSRDPTLRVAVAAFEGVPEAHASSSAGKTIPPPTTAREDFNRKSRRERLSILAIAKLLLLLRSLIRPPG